MKFLLGTACLGLGLSASVAGAVPRVAADIAPVQAIVARVMAGVGEPGLVLPPGASPHGYALRPSEARLLQDADLVVWVGPSLTPWLADPIATLATHADVLTLSEADGVTTLPVRAGGPFEAHDHGDDGDQDEDHAHDGDEGDHGHDDGHDEHAHDEHGDGVAVDGHLWLDPLNAVAAARAVAAALSAEDPENAGAYAANAEAFAAETEVLARRIEADLAPVRGRPFIVFHDGYQYFEHAFDLPAAGSVALHDGDAPGPARIAAIRERVRDAGVVCALAEPEFAPGLLSTVVEGTDVRIGQVDGIGALLTPGADLYPALMQGVADGIAACLAP